MAGRWPERLQTLRKAECKTIYDKFCPVPVLSPPFGLHRVLDLLNLWPRLGPRNPRDSFSDCFSTLGPNVRPGEKKAHKHKFFALVNVQMALGQTAGCPRVNRAKKFMCSPRITGNINFCLWSTGGLSQGCPDFRKAYSRAKFKKKPPPPHPHFWS